MELVNDIDVDSAHSYVSNLISLRLGLLSSPCPAPHDIGSLRRLACLRFIDPARIPRQEKHALQPFTGTVSSGSAIAALLWTAVMLVQQATSFSATTMVMPAHYLFLRCPSWCPEDTASPLHRITSYPHVASPLRVVYLDLKSARIQPLLNSPNRRPAQPISPTAFIERRGYGIPTMSTGGFLWLIHDLLLH